MAHVAVRVFAVFLDTRRKTMTTLNMNPAVLVCESDRDLCGLLPLRGWRNAKVHQVLPGGA
jgi:hypothetical protein